MTSAAHGRFQAARADVGGGAAGAEPFRGGTWRGRRTGWRRYWAAPAGQGELRRTFERWVWVLGRGLYDSDAAGQWPEGLDLEDMAVSLEDRVREWRKPYIQQGREEGIRIGLEHERQLLRRLAATRFDSATADRLAVAIGGEADPERLMAVGEAIVRCATGGELLREVGSRR